MNQKREALYFYLFITPWLIGFIIFMLYPVISSLYYSFTDYNILTPPAFIGFKNYSDLFGDELIGYSIKATLYYTLLSVPLGLIVSIIMAVLVNQNIPGKNVFRTVLYLPGMISGVAMSLLWMWIFNPQIGFLNYFLSLIGIPGPMWLNDQNWAVPSLIIMSFWSMGSGMVILLAALQGVPESLYEASRLDGANALVRFFKITLPMISPVILFQLIMGIIGSFQVFTQAFIMTQGGPHYATLFYVYYLYQNAFQNFNMGYASAMSWLLLIVVALLTYVIMKFSRQFVYYEGGKM